MVCMTGSAPLRRVHYPHDVGDANVHSTARRVREVISRLVPVGRHHIQIYPPRGDYPGLREPNDFAGSQFQGVVERVGARLGKRVTAKKQLG